MAKVAAKSVKSSSSRKISMAAVKLSSKAAPSTDKPDSETAVRMDKDKLSERIKLVCAKPVRVGEIIATAAQDAALIEAIRLDAEMEVIKRQLANLGERQRAMLAPLCNELDDRKRLAIVGSTAFIRAEAYGASVALKMPGVTHRLRAK